MGKGRVSRAHRARFGSMALAISLMAAGHARSGSADNNAAVIAAPAVARISMRNIQFEPATLELKKGSVVEWKNEDFVAHTATSQSFDSGSLSPGQSWRHTFSETGTFPYACTFHPNMKGVVIVK